MNHSSLNNTSIPFTKVEAQQIKKSCADKHKNELLASAIAPSVIELNFESISGQDVEDFLLTRSLELLSDASGSFMKADVYKLRKRYSSVIEHGGWICQGLDLERVLPADDLHESSWGDGEWGEFVSKYGSIPKSDWGCLKPDAPRVTNLKKDKDGNWQAIAPKLVKYEHPEKTRTSVFALDKPGEPRYWLEVLANAGTPVFITEGAKKAAALLSAGYAAIAVPGVAQWNVPKTRELIDELKMFAREDRTFFIAFDQDETKKTRGFVDAEIFKLSSALRRLKADVRVLSWAGELGKGCDDLIANRGETAFENAVESSKSFTFWAMQHLTKLSVKASYKVPEGQRYLNGKDGSNEPKIPFPTDEKFIAFKAPKGTGKTESLGVLTNQAKAEGRRVLNLSHRTLLNGAMCDRLGLPTVDEVQRGLSVENVGFGLCVQSLHSKGKAQFFPEAWADADIVIDEVVQLIAEALESDTCKANRVEILKNLKILVSNSLSPETRGRLIIADADLNDTAINFLQGLCDFQAPAPWLILSDYQGDDATYTAYIYKCPTQLLDDTERRIEQGDRLMITVDSQRVKSRFSSASLELRWTKHYPDKKILRIDSDTLKLVGHPAFGCMTNLNEIVINYDIVICSPSVETGVSIDVRDYFNEVVSFYNGVVSESGCRQGITRVRDNVPRRIYLPARGLSFVGGGEFSPEDLEASQNKKVTASLGLIFDAARQQSIDSEFLPVAIKTWAKFAALQNVGMTSYREIVVGGLEAEGHDVIMVDKPEPKSLESELILELKDQLISDKHDNLKSEAIAVLEASDLTDTQLAKLEKSDRNKDRDEQLAVKKAILKRMYPDVDLTPDLYILDQYSYYKKLKLHYALTAGRSHVKESDKAKVADMLQGGFNELWGNDLVRSTLSLNVATLELLKIPELLKKKELHHGDRDLVQLASICLANRNEIKSILGFSITESEVAKPVEIAKKFLGLIGFGLGKAERRSLNGKIVRFYPIAQTDSKEFSAFVDGQLTAKAHIYSVDRQQIFNGWMARDAIAEQKRKKMLEVESVQGFEPI